MEISGPLNIALLDRETTPVRELHISFTEEFRALPIEERVKAFEEYIQQLYQSAQVIPQDSNEYQGVVLILQFAQEVFPFIQQDEIPLNETIVVSIQQNVSITALGNYRLKIDGM